MPKRLSPSELISRITNQLLSAGWECNVIHRAVQSECFAMIWQKDARTMIITSPASDNSISLENQNLGTQELGEVLRLIKPLKEKFADAKIFIPTAECRGRAHWTLLQITKHSIDFYDPKKTISCGCFFRGYSLNFIQGYLTTAGYGPMQKYYTGLQSVIDDTICGYVVAYMIENHAKGLGDDFSEFDKTLATADLVEHKNYARVMSQLYSESSTMTAKLESDDESEAFVQRV